MPGPQDPARPAPALTRQRLARPPRPRGGSDSCPTGRPDPAASTRGQPASPGPRATITSPSRGAPSAAAAATGARPFPAAPAAAPARAPRPRKRFQAPPPGRPRFRAGADPGGCYCCPVSRGWLKSGRNSSFWPVLQADDWMGERLSSNLTLEPEILPLQSLAFHPSSPRRPLLAGAGRLQK